MIYKTVIALSITTAIFFGLHSLHDRACAQAQPHINQDSQNSWPSLTQLFTLEELRQGITLEEYIRRLPPSKQKEYCNNAFRKGIFYNLPECWKAVDDPEAILKGVYQFGEPLSDPMIDALNRVFPHLFTHEDRMRAAELLYRYGRDSGRIYLITRLKEQLDDEAAIVFALEQNEQVLPWILQALAKHHNPSLALALGKWKRPEIASSLIREFRSAFAKKQQEGFVNFAFAVGTQGIQETIPDIRDYYNSLSDKSIVKLLVAATLIQLKAEESDRLLAYLITQLSLPPKKLPFMWWKAYVITALGQIGSLRAEEVLLKVVQDYVDNGATPAPEDQRGASGPEGDQLAIQAVLALAQLKVTRSTDLIEKMLLRLKRESLQWEDSAPTIATALLAIDAIQTKPFVQALMGSYWTNRLLRKLMLKPIPSGLPKEERFHADVNYDAKPTETKKSQP